MRTSVIALTACIALAACGDEGRTRANACEGLKTAKPGAIVAFAQVDTLDRKLLCAEAGLPDKLVVRDGRESWTYGTVTYILEAKTGKAMRIA